jgi:DNA-binding Xre family transcriptional regulator
MRIPSVKNKVLNGILADFADDPSFQLAMMEEGLIHRVALRVMQYRKAMGISQPDLAEMIGTKQPRIATLEAGNANVTLRTLAKVAFALGCEAEDLVSERAPYQLHLGSSWAGVNTIDFYGMADIATMVGAETAQVSAQYLATDLDAINLRARSGSVHHVESTIDLSDFLKRTGSILTAAASNAEDEGTFKGGAPNSNLALSA